VKTSPLGRMGSRTTGVGGQGRRRQSWSSQGTDGPPCTDSPYTAPSTELYTHSHVACMLLARRSLCVSANGVQCRPVARAGLRSVLLMLQH